MLSLFVESTRVKIVLRFCVFFRPCAVFERFVVGAIGCLELPAVAHCCSCCRRWPGASARADWRPNRLYWQRNDHAVAAAADAVAALVHALRLSPVRVSLTAVCAAGAGPGISVRRFSHAVSGSHTTTDFSLTITASASCEPLLGVISRPIQHAAVRFLTLVSFLTICVRPVFDLS